MSNKIKPWQQRRPKHQDRNQDKRKRPFPPRGDKRINPRDNDERFNPYRNAPWET